MHVLLPLLLISVTQLNRPTLTPGSSATTVFVVDITNTGIAPIHLTKLGFATVPTERRQYAINRTIAPGATTRIPVLREMGFNVYTRADVTVDATFATPDGEQVERHTIPIRPHIDRAVTVR